MTADPKRDPCSARAPGCGSRTPWLSDGGQRRARSPAAAAKHDVIISVRARIRAPQLGVVLSLSCRGYHKIRVIDAAQTEAHCSTGTRLELSYEHVEGSGFIVQEMSTK